MDLPAPLSCFSRGFARPTSKLSEQRNLRMRKSMSSKKPVRPWPDRPEWVLRPCDWIALWAGVPPVLPSPTSMKLQTRPPSENLLNIYTSAISLSVVCCAVDSRKCTQSLRYLHLLWFKRARVCYGIYKPSGGCETFPLTKFAMKQRS